jgi:hypothetical protein
MPTTWTRDSALHALAGAVSSGRLDRVRVAGALEALGSVPPGDDVVDAVLQLGTAMLGGAFDGRRHADVLEICVRLLARTEERRALGFYRAAAALEMPTSRGDLAAALRGLALAAMHPLEPRESRFVAVRLLGGERSPSGEPARTALAVLGAAGDDTALMLACRTVLGDEIPLQVAALQEMSSDVPAEAFWDVAAPLVGDRFADAVLAITDLIVEGRRAELLPGLAATLPQVSDPDLWRAVLLSLLGSRLDGVEAVFAAGVEHAPPRALPGVEEALMLARLERQEALLARLSERARSMPPAR